MARHHRDPVGLMRSRRSTSGRRFRHLHVGRGHLQRALQTYVRHGEHRPHRALALEAPDRPAGLALVAEARQGSVYRRDLLGGLLHEYRRAA